MFKFIGILAFVAVTKAIELQHAYPAQYVHSAPLVKTVQPVLKYAAPTLIKQVEVESPAHYDFSYSVQDHHTGDVKSQQESRKGDVVHGQYSLIDADGYLRVVDYTSDAHNGFNAVVRREPLGHKVVKAVAPVAKILAPAPVHYAAPVAHYAAPVAHYQPVLHAKVAVQPALTHVSVAHPAYAYHH